MNPNLCAELADRLPDWAAERLPSAEAARVAEHVRACAECTAEVALIRALLARRPAVPADLAVRIGAALGAAEAEAGPARARPRARSGRMAWATSAAAVLALAVGTLVLRDGDPAVPSGLGQMPLEGETVWIADDGIVAGAPVLDELSDDALALLLEEME